MCKLRKELPPVNLAAVTCDSWSGMNGKLVPGSIIVCSMGSSTARGVKITGVCRSPPLPDGVGRRRLAALSGLPDSAARRQIFFGSYCMTTGRINQVAIARDLKCSESTPNPTTQRAAAPLEAPRWGAARGELSSCTHGRTSPHTPTWTISVPGHVGAAHSVTLQFSPKGRNSHRCSPSPEWAPLSGGFVSKLGRAARDIPRRPVKATQPQHTRHKMSNDRPVQATQPQHAT